MSPGGRPRLLVFSSVAQASHQSQPNSSNSSSVVAPLMNAHSSPIGLRQKLLMLRSVIDREAVGQVEPHGLLHQRQRVRALPGRRRLALVEDAGEQVAVLRVGRPLVIRHVRETTALRVRRAGPDGRESDRRA